jgi:hypothetical protein
MMRHRHRRRGGFREKTALRAQRTEWHRTAPSIGLPATPQDVGLVPCRQGPRLHEVFGTGVCR